MYRSDLNNGDKGRAIAAVVAIHAALLFALLNLSRGSSWTASPDSVIQTFDVSDIKPPPPPPPPSPPRKANEKEGGSAPKNVRTSATPVAAPKPMIETPVLNPIAATETPAAGAAPTQGASNVRGPGTGAGGAGSGSGTGNGAGAGSGGGAATSVMLVRGITARDYPRGVMEEWPRGGAVYLRLRIEPDGRPSRCDVMRSFGNALVDQWTCSLVMQRGQFRPALDARGAPVAAWFGYKQVDVGRGM